MALSQFVSTGAPPLAEVLEKLIPQDAPPSAAPRFTTKAIGLRVPVYYLPEATDRQRKAVMAAMTLVGRSLDPTPMKWQSFVLTWTCLVFPEMAQAIQDSANEDDYHLVSFDVAFVISCVDAIIAQGSQETLGDKYLAFPPGLPESSAIPMTANVASAGTSIEGLYAYYAMIVFIMGKSLNTDTMASIATKRPAALIKKRQIGRSEYILTGDGRILQDNYGKIQGGWIRSTVPRIIIVKHLALLYHAPQHPETLDAVVVNMDMLRNAGQTYMFSVYELLAACDWCLQIPALAAAYRHFSRMVNILHRQPAYLQPFFKLMMQDAVKDFRRRDIEALVGVAIFYSAQIRVSMKRYRVNPECRPVVQEFIRMAAARGHTFVEISDQAAIETTTI